MSLSLSTTILFVILIPGIIFRFFLFSETPIRRSLSSSNTIYISVFVILYAILIHVFTMVMYNFASRALNQIFDLDIEIKIKEVNSKFLFSIHNVDLSYFSLVDSHPYIATTYSILTLIFAYMLAKFVIWLSQKWLPLGRVMYGPLATLVSSEYTELFTCYVLTKIELNNKRVMYQGYPVEVILNNGSNIDHIVLKNPDKYYMTFDSELPTPVTTRNESRAISANYGAGLLYISGSEIENVHFESWLF